MIEKHFSSARHVLSTQDHWLLPLLLLLLLLLLLAGCVHVAGKGGKRGLFVSQTTTHTSRKHPLS